MKTETMLMVLVAFVIGWFSRTMMSGLVEGQKNDDKCISMLYAHLQTKNGQEEWPSGFKRKLIHHSYY
jgi:hypothetical protein